jgi:hypothetical protein
LPRAFVKILLANWGQSCIETWRAATWAWLAADPEWMPATVPLTWEERYGQRRVA